MLVSFSIGIDKFDRETAEKCKLAPTAPGNDIAGIVHEVGAKVAAFKRGPRCRFVYARRSQWKLR